MPIEFPSKEAYLIEGEPRTHPRKLRWVAVVVVVVVMMVAVRRSQAAGMTPRAGGRLPITLSRVNLG